MFERIFEIIVLILNNLDSNTNLDEFDYEKFNKLGYSKSEVSAAFSWIAEKKKINDLINLKKSIENNNKTFRIFHPYEEEFFTDNARNELIQYNLLGLISDDELENLLTKSLLIGFDSIDSSELKHFIVHFVFQINKKVSGTNKLVLTGNETIH